MAENEAWWGLALYGQSNEDAAHNHFVRALELARAAGYTFMEPGTLKGLAMTALYGDGDYATAHAHLVEGLERARTIGDRQSEANVLVTLGDLSKKVGLYREAEAALTRSVALARSTGDRWSETFALGNLATLAATEGAYDRALEYTTQTQALAQAIGERGVQAFTHMLIGHVEAGSGRWDAAAAAYRQSYNRYKAIDWPENVQPLAYLARSALMLGDITQALAQTELVLMRVETSQLHHAEEPLHVDLICYQVLRAANDPRAHAVLERAHARLLEQAAKISDEAMRHSFLHNVPYHREIATAWAKVNHENH
jgi:tetratricopeptide (TPR) repeat protein